jgi:hypothetical protein
MQHHTTPFFTEEIFMDWTPYMSGMFALGGALLGVIGGVAVQIVTQRNENRRYITGIIAEAAVKQWEQHVKSSTSLGLDPLPLKAFFVPHVDIMLTLFEISGRLTAKREKRDVIRSVAEEIEAHLKYIGESRKHLDNTRDHKPSDSSCT